MGGVVSKYGNVPTVNEYAKKANDIPKKKSGFDTNAAIGIAGDILNQYTSSNQPVAANDEERLDQLKDRNSDKEVIGNIGNRALQGFEAAGPAGAFIGGAIGMVEGVINDKKSIEEKEKLENKISSKETEESQNKALDENAEIRKELASLPDKEEDVFDMQFNALKDQYGDSLDLEMYNRKKNGYAK